MNFTEQKRCPFCGILFRNWFNRSLFQQAPLFRQGKTGKVAQVLARRAHRIHVLGNVTPDSIPARRQGASFTQSLRQNFSLYFLCGIW
ncbi:protein of unknown function [Candidatus Nitrospira inopinata]|uniref:Uncharacterized protein n=1 Tax=Candidatus Nitrospira inopinata TaxID=1715989 RepID=A0A0S4KVI7_9BACT|nr:protein of unknown function [Candidatus Nitrospira inopinata]